MSEPGTVLGAVNPVMKKADASGPYLHGEREEEIDDRYLQSETIKIIKTILRQRAWPPPLFLFSCLYFVLVFS